MTKCGRVAFIELEEGYFLVYLNRIDSQYEKNGQMIKKCQYKSHFFSEEVEVNDGEEESTIAPCS